MLKVSRRSWHMRLVRWTVFCGKEYEPENLCMHVLDVVMALALIVCGTIVIAVTDVVLFTLLWEHWRASLLIIGAAVAGMALWYILYRVLVWTDPLGFRRQRPKPPRPPNLLVEYVKAKKRRVCPLLEVVD